MNRFFIGLTALLLALWCSALPAFGQQAVPALTGHVVDTTSTLSPEEVASLEEKLQSFEQVHGSQIVVLLVPSTQPEDIASYANRVANVWKVGRKSIGDGLLIVVAISGHKLRLEVAKTLEGAIPDLAAKRIIDEAIVPRFKQGDYFGGLDSGVDRAMGLIRGEALPAPVVDQRATNAGFDWMDLGIFLFVAVPVIGAVARGILGSRLGAMATGGVAGLIAMTITASLFIALFAGFGAMVFTLLSASSGRFKSQGTSSRGDWFPPSTGHGGAGGSFGSGGGFSSGGGGDFGGGGASGDW